MVYNGDGTSRTNVFTGMHQAPSAGRGDHHAGGRTFVAGRFHDLHWVGVILVSTHSHVNAVLYNGSFFIDAAVKVGFWTRADDFGDFKVGVLQSSFVGSTDNFF